MEKQDPAEAERAGWGGILLTVWKCCCCGRAWAQSLPGVGDGDRRCHAGPHKAARRRPRGSCGAADRSGNQHSQTGPSSSYAHTPLPHLGCNDGSLWGSYSDYFYFSPCSHRVCWTFWPCASIFCPHHFSTVLILVLKVPELMDFCKRDLHFVLLLPFLPKGMWDNTRVRQSSGKTASSHYNRTIRVPKSLWQLCLW